MRPLNSISTYEGIKDILHYSYGCYHKKIANNTHLTLKTDKDGVESIDMRLHGNIVARFFPTHLCLYDGGYRSRVTKSRLNLALDMAGIPNYIFQMDWEWYLLYPLDRKFSNGMIFFYREM